MAEDKEKWGVKHDDGFVRTSYDERAARREKRIAGGVLVKKRIPEWEEVPD